jgi:hypothetical protein
VGFWTRVMTLVIKEILTLWKDEPGPARRVSPSLDTHHLTALCQVLS